MLTYVLNSNGQPLMPTSRSGKVRRLLKDKKAKAVKRCPFTIQLLYEAENNVQPVPNTSVSVPLQKTKFSMKQMLNFVMTS